jgi:hypothetical protein
VPSSTRSPLVGCRTALIRAFVGSSPDVELDSKGYVSNASQNLIEGVHLGDFEADLRQGDGNEMEGKFRAVHSSSALAINTFAPFKTRKADLHLPGGDGFADLCFERKCPHGLKGRRVPNLDVVAEAPTSVVAVESKCLETLTAHVADFSPAYDAEIRDARRDSAWFQEMPKLVGEPRAYRWLDAAQLVKHAFGIANTFAGRRTTLLYLYWEPSNPEAYPAFAEHQAEVLRFAASMHGASPAFVAMSYPELWNLWDSNSPSEWLRSHVGRLKARYAVSV